MPNEKNTKMIELERPPVIEKALLVRVVLPSDLEDDVDESLEEMKRLAWTAGADVVCTLIQRRPKPCPATLVGSGKLETIEAVCAEHEADLVIFDSDLTPSQGVKLQDRLGAKVLDRTQLILDIFAQRARTNEGKHQVELALLEYTLPRLVGRGSALMRQKGGIGLRGPGEQKLEVDRRVIRDRIRRLKAELEEIRKHRGIQRKRRKEEASGTVALVGYTNAGKSSLLNAVTGAEAFVENKLFATLDPTSRRCILPSQREVVFTDTVGFIRKLPHSLVAAFRATLEEVTEADLLLMVVDASHHAAEEQVRAVRVVLEEIGALDKPALLVFNKMDIADPGHVRQLSSHVGAGIQISAKSGYGLDSLLAEVDRLLAPVVYRVRLRVPQSEGSVVARIHDSGRIISVEYHGNEVVIDAEVDGMLKNRVAQYIL